MSNDQCDMFGGEGKFKGAAYPAPPGSGPDGKKCKDCQFLYRHKSPTLRVYPKCDLTEWTCGKATDIRVNSPACHNFRERDDE